VFVNPIYSATRVCNIQDWEEDENDKIWQAIAQETDRVHIEALRQGWLDGCTWQLEAIITYY